MPGIGARRAGGRCLREGAMNTASLTHLGGGKIHVVSIASANATRESGQSTSPRALLLSSASIFLSSSLSFYLSASSPCFCPSMWPLTEVLGACFAAHPLHTTSTTSAPLIITIVDISSRNSSSIGLRFFFGMPRNLAAGPLVASGPSLLARASRRSSCPVLPTFELAIWVHV